MADVHTKEQRSFNISQIRGTNTTLKGCRFERFLYRKHLLTRLKIQFNEKAVNSQKIFKTNHRFYRVFGMFQ